MELQSASLQYELPTVKDGRLKFENAAHLKSFYESIQSQINEMSGDSNFVLSTYLINLAHECGYESALSKYDETFLSDQRDSLPHKWLNDDIRLFMLNEYFELEIEGKILVYQSINQIYLIPNDQSIIEEFQSWAKGDDRIVPTIVFERDDIVPLSKIISDKGTKRGGDGECYIIARMFELKDPCNPGYRGFNLILNQYWWPESGSPQPENHVVDVTIYYGDGFSEQRNDVTLSLLRFNHEYTSSGTFNVYVVVNWLNNCTGIEEELLVDYLNLSGYQNLLPNSIQIDEGSCQDANLSQGYYIQNGNFKMHAEIWFIDDLFGGHQGAKTTSYKYKNPLCCPQGWYKDNAYTLADINWHFRNGNCLDIIVDGNVAGLETDWCSWCNSKRANKTTMSDGNFHIGDNEVFSHHYVENGGTSLSYDIVFDICE